MKIRRINSINNTEVLTQSGFAGFEPSMEIIRYDSVLNIICNVFFLGSFFKMNHGF